MRGIVFTGHSTIELQEFPDPTPGPGEVVLEIKASGMCGSDLKFYRAAPGEMQRKLGVGEVTEPFIGGHEPCGVVVAVGSSVTEQQARVGQRMMHHHYSACGACLDCNAGWPQMCGNGFVVYGVTTNGAHAPYMKGDARGLVELPEELSFQAGAAISCGTGTAFGALKRMQISGRDTLAIFGQGPVGLSAAQLATAMGARVIALDTSPERRELAKGFGADVVIDPSAEDPVQALKDLTHGKGVDKALDCSGSEAARSAAVKGSRAWGTVCMVGEGGNLTVDVSRDLMRKQLTIIGSWTFSSVTQGECARFIADRGVDMDGLFSHHFALDQAEEAYTLFDTQTTAKGVFLS